jgi:AcrR family transcriptional regulator
MKPSIEKTRSDEATAGAEMKDSLANPTPKGRSASRKSTSDSKEEINRQSQKLGSKGRRTRRLITETARELLRTTSPMEVTAVAIARRANISSASFYMYFNDISDLIYQMSAEIGEQFQSVIPIIDRPWDLENPQKDALEFVEAFSSIWSESREVLMYRNLEADLGNPRFDQLWRSTLRPIVAHLGDKIREGAKARGRTISIMDSRCRAVTLTCAMERFSASNPRVVAEELNYNRLIVAFADIVADTVRCTV